MFKAQVAMFVCMTTAFIACGAHPGKGDGLFACDVPEGCGPAMRPGQNCLRCHREGASERGGIVPALAFSAGGTVYEHEDAGPQEVVAGVLVTLIDANEKQVELVSNHWGNFYTEEPLQYPLRLVRLQRDGREVTMPLNPHGPDTPAYPPPEVVGENFYAPAGSCNVCHNQPSEGGAPGRMYAP